MLLPAVLSLTLVAAQPAPKLFDLKDGDRIVWIGNTLVEREQRYGFWETALLVANKDKKITFRNLGWSGDTVHGEARGRFDFANPDFCFKQLVSLTLELNPTVIFVSYGTNESFEGKEGLAKFEKGLNKLLDALKPAKARIVLFTPLPFEPGPSFPAAAARNTSLRDYADVVRQVAKARDLYCADLYEIGLKKIAEFENLKKKRVVHADERLTENGMHLSESGYRSMTIGFLQSLGIVGELPGCLVGVEVPAAVKRMEQDCEPLRQAVIEKDQLFFYRWRPQNETYLFGFRKHEQGKNGKEVAEFDPLVGKAEDEITRLLKAISGSSRKR